MVNQSKSDSATAFSEDEVRSECDYSKATFKVDAKFEGKVFNCFANFSEATFKGSADFTGAVFHNGASFKGAKFICNNKDVSFENAVFLPSEEHDVDFYEAQFGLAYQLELGEWYIEFKVEDEQVNLIRFKKEEKDKYETLKNIPQDGDLEKFLKPWKLENSAKEIAESLKIFKGNPKTVSLANCRFGDMNLPKLTEEELREVIKIETNLILESFQVEKKKENTANHPLNQIETYYTSTADAQDTVNEATKTAVARILARHLSLERIASFRKKQAGNVNFEKAELNHQSSTTFEDALFINTKNVSFNSAIFSNAKDVSFKDTLFINTQDVSFSSATFSNARDVTFKNTQYIYTQNVSFNSTAFSNARDVTFQSTTFNNKGNIDFNSATFSNARDVTFQSTTFNNKGNIDFNSATFSNEGYIDFNSATFSNEGDVTFQSTIFSNEGDLTFYSTTFSNTGVLTFQSATFSNEGDLTFYSTTFSNTGVLTFQSATFSNTRDVTFQSATFSNAGDVTFQSATFSNTRDVTFQSATFSNTGALTFQSATFSNTGDVTFQSSIFSNSGYASFYSTIFSNTGVLTFQSATFSNAGDVTFQSAKFLPKKGLTLRRIIWMQNGGLFFFSAGFSESSKIKFEECLFLPGGNILFKEIRFPEQSSLLFQRCYFSLPETGELDFTATLFRHATFEGGLISWLENKNSRERKPQAILNERLRKKYEMVPYKVQKRIEGLQEEIPEFSPVFEKDTKVLWKNLTTESAKNLTFSNTSFSSSLFDGMTLSHIQLNASIWRDKKGRKILYREKELQEESKKHDSEQKEDTNKSLIIWLKDKKDSFETWRLKEISKLEEAEPNLDQVENEKKHDPHYLDKLRDIGDQYTQLKNNLEKQGAYQESGYFHNSEQEIRQKILLDKLQFKNISLKNLFSFLKTFLSNLVIFIFGGWYKLSSGYGEKPSQAILSVLGLALVLTLFNYNNLEFMSLEKRPTGINIRLLFETFMHTISPFSWKIIADKNYITDSNWCQYAMFFGGQLILLVIQVPMLVMAVRRQFKR
jgi:hypothetical protein